MSDMISFGKYKGQKLKNIPIDYIKWAAKNITQNDTRKLFETELQNRETKNYNPLIFGKNQTEKIINITIEPGNAIIYKADNTREIIEYDPWVLTPYPAKKYQSEELKGDQYYKYLTHVPDNHYKELIANRFKRDMWVPRSLEEGFMLKYGYTYFKGMKVSDVSLLSFDIEATGLNPKANNAEVILISNTFRDRTGEIKTQLFSIKDYDTCKEMIEDWCKWVRLVNPDIMLGHNVFAYDLPYLSEHAELSLGRDGSEITFEEKDSKFRKDGSQSYTYNNAHINGREIIDTMFLSIKYDIGRNFPSYGLKRIEKYLDLVDDDRIEWDFNKYPTNKYKEFSEETWNSFVEYCNADSDSPIKMFDLMVPSFFYLNQSVPKTLQQMINEAAGGQLDSLMIRSYLQDGYSQPKSSNRESFQGAISMGTPGIYKNVKKVDVASLYPSIMLEYNIYNKQKDPNRHMLEMLEYFRNERLTNKKLAKETKDSYYVDMQSSQKIIINSMYGFMGAGYVLYNYPEGASNVTSHGREILQKGVEWATGARLKKVVKQIRNKGKENEEIKYEWVLGDKVSEGRGYALVNVDTDSFSVTNGIKPTQDEFNQEVEELNSIYPKLIRWENDGLFDKVIVIKAKNYILEHDGKIKYKGSSLTDQKKEPILLEFLEKMINCLLENDLDKIVGLYDNYCLDALTLNDISAWVTKKTITKSVLNPERLNEQKVLDACNEAIEKNVISGVQEGDKVWLYQAIDGEIEKRAKGEVVTLKDGTPKMIEKTVLRFPELYKNDHDKWYYVARVYKTLKILENVVDISQFTKYNLKANRSKLKKPLTNEK